VIVREIWRATALAECPIRYRPNQCRERCHRLCRR
jgi:hypothetical protein